MSERKPFPWKDKRCQRCGALPWVLLIDWDDPAGPPDCPEDGNVVTCSHAEFVRVAMEIRAVAAQQRKDLGLDP